MIQAVRLDGGGTMAITAHVHNTITEFVAQQGYTPAEKVFGVAVSGGIDSMVLLHALHHCALRHGWHVYAVHVNHNLRDTATRDAEFVKRLCREWHIDIVCRDVDVHGVAPSASAGVEADARRLRYEAIAEVARSRNAPRVFLAHHADDQMETVLWRISRGTTLTGLAGIRPLSTRDGVGWLRPLLGFEKSQLLQYAEENRIAHVEDETNTNTEYTRNYIRHRIVPALREIQPKVAHSIHQMTQIIQDEDALLEQLGTQLVSACSRPDSDAFRIDILTLLQAPRPLQRRAIKILLYCLTSADWAAIHVEAILALLNHPSPSAEVHLPAGIRARREYETLLIGRLPPVAEPFTIRWLPQDGSRLDLPAKGDAPSWSFTCQRVHVSGSVRAETLEELLIPLLDEVVIEPVDTRQRVKLLGLNGTKKVQDIFVDAKVPRHLRSAWPGVYLNGELIWLPGIARSRVALVGDTDKEAWRILAYRGNSV